MNSKFEIKEMSQKPCENGCSVTYKISFDGKDYDLNYLIEGDIESVPERCDAVVVTFFVYALTRGYDFVSNIPMTDVLHYKLTRHVIPHFVFFNEGKAKEIKIDAPLVNESFKGDINATGVSLGVDSFAAIKEYSSDDISEEYRLTHLVHLRVGAHHGGKPYQDNETEEKLFLEENKRVKEYCQKTGKKLITIQSNLYDITCREFGTEFEPTHLFRNMGAILLIQNRVKRYYYASSQSFKNFYIKVDKSSAAYEKWILPYLSTESTALYSTSGSKLRPQKVEYILDYKDTHDFLHVCWMDSKNCGVCNKCLRTLIQLDSFGAVDLYKNVFDVEEFKRNRKKYIRKAASLSKIDSSYRVLIEGRKKQGLWVPGPISVFFTRVSLVLSNISKYGFKYVLQRIKHSH